MTDAFVFGISYLFLKLLSFLPMPLLNGLSWFIFQVLYRILHYRKKIILKNIRNSFPEKNEKEVNLVCRNYYRYFARMITEGISLLQLSPRKIRKYVKLKNPDLVKELYRKGISVAAVSAHYGNWEWLQAIRPEIPHLALAIYKPLNNKYFNAFFCKLRSKFGTGVVNMREAPRALLDYRMKKEKTFTLFISDQSPVWEEVQYWTPFLNQNTAVYLGMEKMARKLKMAVVYLRMGVEKKNRYTVEYVCLTEDASQQSEYELTEMYLRMLEEDIRNAPQYWLWSHRRWKLTERRSREEADGIYRFDGRFKKK